jgi:hypothetical protein
MFRAARLQMDIWPDAGSRSAQHASGMANQALMRQRRNSVTRLYDSACELVFAAQELRSAACERDSAPAMPATIGCIDATLEAVGQAIAAMSRTAVAEVTAARGEGGQAGVADLVESEFAALADAIRLAQAACDRARERTAPALAQLALASVSQGSRPGGSDVPAN